MLVRLLRCLGRYLFTYLMSKMFSSHFYAFRSALFALGVIRSSNWYTPQADAFYSGLGSQLQAKRVFRSSSEFTPVDCCYFS